MDDNFKNTLNDEKSAFPKNVRQIGEVESGSRIYIEDYAYTYMHQFVSKNNKEEQIAFLIGNTNSIDGEKILKISGVIIPEHLKREDGNVEITAESWDFVYEQTDQFFNDNKILGWVYTQPGYGVLLTSYLVAKHKENFKNQDQVLFVIDPIEKEEAFFAMENDDLMAQSGFFIYYEKNTNMHEYMLRHKLEKNKKTEIELDEVIRTYRAKEQVKREEIDQRKFVNMLTAVSGALIIICIIIGVGLISNIEKTNSLKDAFETVIQDYNNLKQGVSSKNEGGNSIEAINEIDDGETLINTDEGTGDIQLINDDNGDNQDDANEANPTDDSSSGNEATQAVINIEVPDVYTVKNGDNLIKISYMFYNNKEMVAAIQELNNIDNPHKIYVGQKIILPQPQ